MNLILFKRSELSKDGKSVRLLEKDPRTKHIFGHLRKVDGDSVTIGVISGRKGTATVRANDDDGKRLDFDVGSSPLIDSFCDGGCDETSDQRRCEIVLVLSLPFPKRLKTLWPQITSMGVTRICIIRGGLSDPDYCNSRAITPEVYRPLVEEGMSQGCHTREVSVDVEVREVVSRTILEKLGLTKTARNPSKTTDVAIFLDCGDEALEPQPCRQVIMEKLSQGNSGKKNRVILAVGSERGWTDDEARLFHEAGYESASLGRSILRVDTATIAGLGIVCAALDELERGEQKTQTGNAIDSSRKRKQDI